MAALTGSQEKVETMRQAFEERRNYIVERMNAIPGVSCIKPEGAFYVMMNLEKLIGKTIHGVEITDDDVFADAFPEIRPGGRGARLRLRRAQLRPLVLRHLHGQHQGGAEPPGEVPPGLISRETDSTPAGAARGGALWIGRIKPCPAAD